MSIGRPELAGLIAKITSAIPEVREEGTENVCDWSRSFDPLEARVVVRVLSVMACHEENSVTREAQLNAIGEILDPRSMTRDDVAPVFEIPVASLGPSEICHLEGIEEALVRR
ncbi:hypothetical protein [Lentzea flava]|uniref:Uncharacterized protein n=1 Tax=Lentzea flava TaxID=103732 RepID=A0ABQ2UYD5_9PSEU|nr:hypothetical protein [Lentzea flava]MCP2202479.1 hypothetical protein [Lentzea flava]GGU59374.1 hypothetical protein GCM10010178_59530 [Lentzea flava]